MKLEDYDTGKIYGTSRTLDTTALQSVEIVLQELGFTLTINKEMRGNLLGSDFIESILDTLVDDCDDGIYLYQGNDEYLLQPFTGEDLLKNVVFFKIEKVEFVGI